MIFTHPTSRRRFLLVNLVFLLGANVGALASPSGEISRAVIVGGATSVKQADAHSFVLAFSSVFVRARKSDDTLAYLSAAVKLRPDFAAQITVAALNAHRRDGKDSGDKQISCDWVARIIRAAVTANPDAAAAITKATLLAEPSARQCIIAAAIAAAPDQRVAILEAAAQVTDESGLTAFLRPSGVDAGNINSSAIGTINPGNIGSGGQGNVNSPETP